MRRDLYRLPACAGNILPGPAEDAFEALQWVAVSASALGLDATNLAVGGDSAGANLAIAAALRARRDGPSLRHLGLIYPALDPACQSGSHRAFAKGHILTRGVMLWLWRCYLGNGDR